MKPTKVEPLRCPQCSSLEVSPGFSKRVKNAFVRDTKIYCYSCKKTTNIKTGKTEAHGYSANII